jgi:hypothetical protein
MTNQNERRPERHPEDRYRQFTAGDCLVLYDREDTSRWIETDTTVPAADMR